MQTEVMPETPTLSFAVLFTIILVFASFLGIEVFARSAEILFPIFLFIFLVFLVCISPQINIENIQPVFETKTPSLITGILKFMVFFIPARYVTYDFPLCCQYLESRTKGILFRHDLRRNCLNNHYSPINTRYWSNEYFH